MKQKMNFSSSTVSVRLRRPRARPRRLATAGLCLCVSTALAAPVHAAPHARIPVADLFTPAEVVNVPAPGQGAAPPVVVVKVPSSNFHAPGESAPSPPGAAGIPFAPTGRRWMQPRIQVHNEPVPPTLADPGGSPTPPFLVARSLTGGPPIVLAVTPPGEAMPVPRPHRPPLAMAFGVGLLSFVLSYSATVVGARHMRVGCGDDGDEPCIRYARTMLIPLAGPMIVATHTRDPRQYVFAALQTASVLLAVIGAIAFLHDRHRRRILDERGIRIARNTALRPDGGPSGGGLTVHTRF